jgi:hypothetical protein
MHNMDDTLSEPEFMDDMLNDHDHDTSAAAEADTNYLSKRCDIIAQQMWVVSGDTSGSANASEYPRKHLE